MAHEDVLVIDDDNGIRETLRDLLELEGFRVSTAGNGHEGLEQIKHSLPCLVLLDLMMPVMNGWEFLRNLQTEHRELLSANRVAVISAAAHDGGQLEEYGCPLLPKPLNIDRLLTLAHACCPRN